MHRHISTYKIGESPAEAGANTHSPDSAVSVNLQDTSTVLAEYKPLVNQIAATQFRKLPAEAPLQFNDLAQAGLIGLIQAAEKYDSRRGNLREYINRCSTTSEWIVALFKLCGREVKWS